MRLNPFKKKDKAKLPVVPVQEKGSLNIISKSQIFITYHYHVAIDDTFTM